MLKRLLALALLAGVVSLAALACGDDEVPPTPARLSPPFVPEAPVPPSDATLISPGCAEQPGGTEVTVVNRDVGGSGVVEFDPSELDFKLGAIVTFELVAETEYHTFTVDDLGIDCEVDGGTTPGATATFTHTFDRAGTFKLVCLVHELDGMVGTITVSQ